MASRFSNVLYHGWLYSYSVGGGSGRSTAETDKRAWHLIEAVHCASASYFLQTFLKIS